MNGCRSLWHWLQWSTIRTGPLRTPPQGARRQAPVPERERSASSTTTYGHRSDLSPGCGQHRCGAAAGGGAAAHRGAEDRAHALRADPRRSCAVEGGTAGGFLQGFGHRGAAEVIEVPKVSQDIIPQRSVDLVPQMVEQLVEVPTILTPTRIALRIAEQIADIPVPGRGVLGSPQGSLPEKRTTALHVAQERISERIEQIDAGGDFPSRRAGPRVPRQG